ncbi:hypothetical protein C8D89_104371 [Actinomycetospora cinnamomea]|uniref:Uncharacterized protein n=1 Tax=Actinomycetospora cinnamomea TaxID=663609 RepID=A0A2U1FGA2_9PSEU|nr:hypothetical protein C8D89_104371 [Actinomycetospora cinnamomea]
MTRTGPDVQPDDGRSVPPRSLALGAVRGLVPALVHRSAPHHRNAREDVP